MSKKILLSAIVLAQNEEANLARCLTSLSWCDEILVIDDNSIDKTREIAQKHGAKVLERHLSGNFSGQRNFGLSKARGEWVLFIDADEKVSKKLKQEIHRKIGFSEFDGFYLVRRDWLFGKYLKHGESGQIKLLRLGRKNAGRWQRAVHETWQIKGQVGSLKEPLEHYPHPTVAQFIKHLNFHTSLHAGANIKEGKQISVLKVLFFPLAKFFQNFILKRGFLDGAQGFLAAVFMSWHSYLSWSKAWLRKN